MRSSGHNPATTPPAESRSESTQRVALARVKRATSQLARWHNEYEDALSNAHHLGIPDRELEDSGAGRRPEARNSESRITAPSLPGVAHTGRVPAEVRDVSFPVAVRGYERHAVDDYVKQVNRVIAELEVSRSPQAAVRHALDRVGEQTSGILERAGETAEEIVAGAHADADETTTHAKTEAAKIKADASEQADEMIASARSVAEETTARANAEAEEVLASSRAEAANHLKRAQEEIKSNQDSADKRMRELKTDTDAIEKQRSELIEEIRQLAGRLEELVGGSEERFQALQK